jgi:ribosomal protein S18 acetylase RimI-like enzyme
MRASSTFKCFKILLLLALFGLAFLFATKFEYSNKSDVQILDFNKQRDTQFLIDSFDEEKYLLTNNPDFSVQFMVDHMSPVQHYDPTMFGKQQIKILFAKGQPVGFIAYYMKSFFEGKIHLLEVRKAHHGHGYATKLVQYAIADLQHQGAKVIKLDTRSNNIPARSLYTKLGFQLTDEDDGFVHFALKTV